MVRLYPRLRFLTGLTYNDIKNSGPFLDALLVDRATDDDDAPKLTVAASAFLAVERTLLDLAAAGHHDGVRRLLACPPGPPRRGCASFPVDVAWRDPVGNTALHLAARSGSVETVRAVTDHAPDLVRARNVDGHTALHVAAEAGHRGAVAALVERGADPGVQNRHSAERDGRPCFSPGGPPPAWRVPVRHKTSTEGNGTSSSSP